MNFLQIVQAAARESGHRSLNIQTVENQSGLADNFVQWGSEAWVDLQLKQAWAFMRSSASFPVVSGTRTYGLTDAGIVGLKEWCKSADGNAYVNLVDGDGNYSKIRQIERQPFIDLYERSDFTTAPPTAFCMAESYTLALNTVPAKDYTLSGYYWRTASLLAEDADEPSMSEDWHMAIVWLAVMSYAEYDESPALFNRARRKFKNIYGRMCEDELPEVSFAVTPIAWGDSWR